MSFKHLKVKITTGFRQDQHYTIEADEAHKAYFLFLNPEKRTLFSNGVALIGANIQQITPDYNATMGWNSTHTLNDDDWVEIRSKGIDTELRNVLQLAKSVAQNEPEKINLPLSDVKLLN